MDNLEKLIKENAEMFIDKEPLEGHFERFEKKLKKQAAMKKTIRLASRIGRVAAVGLLMIMSSMWAYNEFIKPQDSTHLLGDINQEYGEIEFFLTSQINSRYEELKNFDFSEDEEFKAGMVKEIDYMDSIYYQLQQELNANPSDERIVEAMIRHYQTKLQVITEVLEKLESYKKYQNTNSNNQNQYESVKL